MACRPTLLLAALAAVAPSVALASTVGPRGDEAGCARGGVGEEDLRPARCTTGRIYTSVLPACDELGLSDEDGEVAARDLLRDGEPLTPASGFDERDCKLPDKAPAVVDCNDTRGSLWVHDMIGTCDMPKVRQRGGGHVLPSRDRPHAPVPTTGLCAGAACSSDTLPLSPSYRLSLDPSWLLLDEQAPPRAEPMVRLAPSRALAPDDVTRAPLLRPPIA